MSYETQILDCAGYPALEWRYQPLHPEDCYDIYSNTVDTSDTECYSALADDYDAGAYCSVYSFEDSPFTLYEFDFSVPF